MPLALYALVLAAFAIGTSEFVIMGLLPDVAADLGVGIPQAGLLVSGYAMGVVVGGPILAVLTAAQQKRRTLVVLLNIFMVGNLLCALAPGYTTLMLARIFTSMAHGTFLGNAAVVGMAIVPRRRQTEAIGLIFSGITLANVIGVPAGIALGHALSWRASFVGVAVMALAALALVARTLPDLPRGSERGIRDEFAALKSPQLLLSLLLSAACSTSLLCLFTYITPFLLEVAHATLEQVTQVLLVFGLGLTLGTTLGGKMGHLNLLRLTACGLAGAMGMLLLMPSVATQVLPCTIALFFWGMLAFGLCPLLQAQVMGHAAEAPTLASTLNHSAFNLGNASGAYIGSIALSLGQPLRQLPWTAAGLALLALALVAVCARLEAGVSRARVPATALH